MSSVGPGRGGKPLTGVDGPMDGWMDELGGRTMDRLAYADDVDIMGETLGEVKWEG